MYMSGQKENKPGWGWQWIALTAVVLFVALRVVRALGWL
jgi:hypothetical protein